MMRNIKELNDIRLAALDLDGTVLNSEKKVTDRTLRSIEDTIAWGIEIVYITGRPFSGLPPELKEVKGVNYVVTSNGAVTYDVKRGIKLRTALLDAESAAEIISMKEIRGLMYGVFIDGVGYSDEETYNTLLNIHRGGLYEQYVQDSRAGVNDIKGYITGCEEGVENIWISTRDQDLRDHINDRIKQQWHLRTVLTGTTDVEAGHMACDKGMALKDLADCLGLSMKNILAVGDNDNDRGMLSQAGVSVAMGNAPEFVKKSASFVTDTNNNDGVARVLELLRR